MKKVLVQLAGWIVFFFVWQRVVYFYIDNLSNRLLFAAYDVGQMALVFYIVYGIITPKLFFRRNKFYFLLGVLATVFLAGLLLTIIMTGFLRKQIVPIEFNVTWNYQDMMDARYFIALPGVFAGFITRLSIDWLQAKRKAAEAEKTRIAAELDYLKMQINPHFLFNAFNTIYIQMDVSKEDAKQTLNIFSEMLRYQLYECNGPRVDIEKEVIYLQQYIELQQLRKDERYEISFLFAENLKGFRIAPFILVPFIENMFKHVSNEQTPNIIYGTLTYDNGELSFYGRNTIDAEPAPAQGGGIGLPNVQRRLELVYPGRFTLHTQKDHSTYTVWLTIRLS